MAAAAPLLSPRFTNESDGSGLPDEWYLRTPDGRDFGPVPRRELDAWVGEMRVSRECRIRRAMTDWVPATTHYAELPSSANQLTPGHGAIWSPSSIYPERHRGTTVLLLGILGLVFTCPIPSLIAWVMGAKDLAKMKARVMDPAGEDMTKVGYVLGMFWSLIWIGAACVLMFLAIASAS